MQFKIMARRMFMSKIGKLIALFLSIIFLSGVLGCTNKSNDGFEEADPNQKAEIVFYVYDQASVYREMAEQFMDIYPNWTVEVQEAKSNFFDNLKIYFGAGNEPDMFFMEPGEISGFLLDDQLLNLSPYLENSTELSEEDLWNANDGYRYDKETQLLGSGDYYAFAKDLSADFMMIYNKSHIDEYDATHEKSLAEKIGYPTEGDTGYPSESIPMSWEQNVKMCRELATFDEHGNLVRYGTIFDYIPWRHIMEWVQMGGGSLFSEDGTTFLADDPAVISAFQHMTDYQYGEYKSTVPFDTNSLTGGYSFKNGDISVVWNGRWAWQAYNWYDANFEIGVAPPPTPEGGGKIYNSTTFVGIAISKTSKYPGVAYKFLEYVMTAGSMLTVKNGSVYNIPGNKTIASGTDYLNPSDPVKKELNNYFYNMTLNAKPLVYSSYIDKGTMEGIFGREYGKTWMTSGGKVMSVEDALLNCKTAIEEVIENNLKRR